MALSLFNTIVLGVTIYCNVLFLIIIVVTFKIGNADVH